MTNEEILLRHLEEIKKLPGISAFGVTRELAFPKPGEGDVDVFLFCDALPGGEERRAAMARAGGCDEMTPDLFDGEQWGHGDRLVIGGVEVFLMYFTKAQAEAQVCDLLRGDWPLRAQDGYYPVGRLAMLATLLPLYDKEGWLAALQQRLGQYPQALRRRVMESALWALGDVEEISHAAQRREPLFYHYALDGKLDAFLQGLFALNAVYFPSRKRTLQYAARFAQKPRDLNTRLMEILRLGGSADTLGQSYKQWQALSGELCALMRQALEG